MSIFQVRNEVVTQVDDSHSHYNEEVCTLAYNAKYIIGIAKYYIQNHSWECPMITSAELCYTDAISLFEKRKYKDAGIRALKSLAYTIGTGHPDYLSCKAKT